MSDSHSPPILPANHKARSTRRWFVLLAALTVLGLVILLLSEMEDTADVKAAKTPPPKQVVSIETIEPTREKVIISAFAEVRPRWSAELKAAVSGRVEKVLDTALAGERVDTDATLITLENTPYVAELAAEELALKEARLQLLKAKKNTAVARKQFKQNGLTPPNELALHIPELRVAEAAVASAKAKIAAAKQQLDNTKVKAPFSGFVIERFVSPGQTVSNGDPLVKLVDDRAFDLTVELGKDDWALLQHPIAGHTALVVDHTDRKIAEALVRQGGGFLDEKTRQYKIYLEIKNTLQTPVLSGDFVRVLLPGVTQNDALDVPASALTQEGYIWHVDTADHLQRFVPDVLFRRQERIVIKAPADIPVWRIATTPLVSFLPGQAVKAQPLED